jgi:hypothetical protein
MNSLEEALTKTRQCLSRLRNALEHLEQPMLDQQTQTGWSVAGTLTHLAFYDDWVIERWKRRLSDGRFQDLPDDITELANAAGARGWNAVSPNQAKTIALEAAQAVADFLAQLPMSALQDAIATRRLNMIDRSRHWEPHLNEIEEAVHRH